MSSKQPNIVQDQLIQFGETVSVKGVSRIIKAKSALLKVMWFIAVITSLCILLWQLSTVCMKYINWPFDTVLQESRDEPLFPDVTFCNTYPTKAFDRYSTKMSMLDFTQFLFDQLLKLSTDNEFWMRANITISDFSKLRMYFASKTAYISNFPITDGNSTIDDGLIYNQVSYSWYWSEIGPECQTPLTQRRWNPNYGSCTTIRVRDECQRQVRGAALILYLDNFPKVVQLIYHYGFIVSQATGAVFVIHAPGTEPDLRSPYTLGPGTENNILLTPTLRTRLPSPYGVCTSQQYIDAPSEPTDKNLLYTKDLCLEICFQQQIVDSCGCMSSDFPFTPHQEFMTNGTVCGNFSILDNSSSAALIKKGFYGFLCTLHTDINLDDCQKKCQSQCEELTYGMTVTTASWPHVSSQLAFYSENLGILQDPRFDSYLLIMNYFIASRNDTETIRMLESVDLLEKNFLQVNLFIDSYHTMLLKDVPDLTADKMLGLIGGSLSLWLGVTIMTLIEVLEFIFSLIAAYFKKNKPSTQTKTIQVAVLPLTNATIKQ